jgi:SpoVK/Ycf46/Vps4 family AAA+-type ATPase
MICGNENDFEDFIENVARVVTKKKNVKTNINFEVKDYDINLVNTDIDIDDLTHKIQKSGKLNFSLCMYGEPGTGKSLYGRYLANVLGVEVVFKRASDLISKWVGETEQNIAAAFAEAKSKKAMLIFDEADSFLQNRNNAHNSWEISQVNEMLTWMESHEYPFICTTNLLDTLDEASLRRFTFKIKFDFMTTAQVNHAIEHFFGIQNANINIKGLTAGDFATVKKKVDFLEIKDLNEIIKMLNDEVKVKKSKTLQDTIGF